MSCTYYCSRHMIWRFSYGGIWYFSQDVSAEPVLVSHIVDEGGNHQGLICVSEHISPGGMVLLGIQWPHHDYRTAISDGMTYSQ